MELQALTGPIFIRNGATQDGVAVPGVMAQPAPPKAVRSRSHDTLFVHLTLGGQPSETAVLAEDLLETFSKSFFQSSGSVTAALRKATLELNQLLLHLNLSDQSPGEGAICSAVLRGQELFTAQAGEAFALLGHSFGVERLPATTPAHLTPLGRTAGLDIRYFHHWLEAGDMLLLADPRLAHLPSQALAPILVGSEIEIALERLPEIAPHETARLLLVEFAEEAPLILPEYGGHGQDGTANAGRGATDPASHTAERLPPPTRQPRRESTPIPRPRRTAELNIDVEHTARKATAQAAIGLSRVTGGLADVIGQLRPPQRQAAEEAPATWAIAGAIAIIIPLLVAAIFAGVYFERGQLTVFSETRQKMNQSLGLGDQETDRTLAVVHYQEVLELAATAEEIRPGDLEVQRLRREAIARLDRISGVTRLQAVPLHTYPEGTAIRSITLGDGLNGGIYTLDNANNLVYRNETDETYTVLSGDAQVILQGGQAMNNQIIAKMIDLMWRPRGSHVSRDGLAVLDDRGTLITHYLNFNETRAVPLGLASQWWVAPTNITQFSERLYVLDPGADEVWRYVPDGEGFITDDRQLSLTFQGEVNISQVADLAIYSEDGSVILLYGDGRLRRYTNGSLLWDESELIRSGLTTPLIAPTSVKIAGSGLNSSIFVSDPGSDRIVQLSLGGAFLAQYKATDAQGRELFGLVQDFAVVEVPLRLFVAVDNVLFLARQE